jgi:hypothetical protein
MTDRLPQVLLDLASEVEANEARLKRHILDAARAGDCDTVINIVEQWLTSPPAEVLADALLDAPDPR